MPNIFIATSIRINSGSGFRMAAIAKYMARNDYKVTLTGIGKPEGNDIGTAEYISIPDLKSFILLVPLVFIVNLAAVLKNRPGLIFVSKPLPSSFLPAFIAKILFNSKIILDFDDVEHDYWKHNAIYSFIASISEKFCVKKASIVTTHTNELMNYISDILKVEKSKIWMLQQGVDLDLFTDSTGESIKKQFQLAGKKVIVYAAHFNVAAKDFNIILNVFKSLSSEINNLLLLAVGDGPDLCEYKKLVAELGIEGKVIFAGYVPHDKIASYFAASDIAINYLSPGLANKCRASIKIREYLASGLFTLCNEISEDVTQFKKYIETFSDTGLESFCASLRSIIDESGKTIKRNEEGMKFIKDNFSWDAIIRQFISRIKSL